MKFEQTIKEKIRSTKPELCRRIRSSKLIKKITNGEFGFEFTDLNFANCLGFRNSNFEFLRR
ncbi:MAG: hypothetical protein AUI36_27265 [Cyanobacteria bacterium 13_1_40CM_2_61_4]|nr:MAG: hypothetical protein AUI36_27265 [Cyanobacteria bacterium 13_1_40CM_2_61_4]